MGPVLDAKSLLYLKELPHENEIIRYNNSSSDMRHRNKRIGLNKVEG